ncbi:uncharacterized protein LOC134814158 isoform X2 [Bolinopsis microptera]|uniref:uncharacterized protein LOC134814158 isoform X2 n=1 Tax=Bolinopsis microptera TaxID=2820187 RepID=UPI00307A85FC
MTITIIILTILLWSSVKGEFPVKRAVEIEWDLESTPLEIRTDSVLGSDDQVYVDFYSAEEKYAGGFALYFTSTPQYELGYCTSGTDFPVNLPSTADKVWRITLTSRVVIHCNEVEVLNKLLSESTCSDSKWRTIWNRDVTKIWFDSDDTASDYYGTQLQLPEDTSEEENESEQGDNQNYSDAAALKVSLIFLVVLLFAVDMRI